LTPKFRTGSEWLPHRLSSSVTRRARSCSLTSTAPPSYPRRTHQQAINSSAILMLLPAEYHLSMVVHFSDRYDAGPGVTPTSDATCRISYQQHSGGENIPCRYGALCESQVHRSSLALLRNHGGWDRNLWPPRTPRLPVKAARLRTGYTVCSTRDEKTRNSRRFVCQFCSQRNVTACMHICEQWR
jgi:hypothetical protein